MSVALKICFMMILALVSTTAYADLQKPQDMAALDWLSELEQERDVASIKQDMAAFNKITQEVSATLAGKYGLRSTPATPEERQQMIASIVRTRNELPAMPGILSQLYVWTGGP